MASPLDVPRKLVINLDYDGVEGYSADVEMGDSPGLELQPTDDSQRCDATVDRDQDQPMQVDPAPLQHPAGRITLSDHGPQSNETRGDPEVVCLGGSRTLRAPGQSAAEVPSRLAEYADTRRYVSSSHESPVQHAGENKRSRAPVRFCEADCVNLVDDGGPGADEADDSTCISYSKGADLEIIGGRPCLRLYPITATNRAADAACPSRNMTPELPRTKVTSCPFGNSRLVAGKTVELADGSFIRITEIIQCSDGPDQVLLRGWRYRRTRELSGGLAKRLNELCMTLDVVEDDDRGPFQQGVVEVQLSEVVRIRRLVMTNRDYPDLSYEQTVPNWSRFGKGQICRELVLVCRWKWITYYKTENHRRRKSESEVAVSKIREDEVDMALRLAEGSRVSDDELRRKWREDRATAHSSAAPQASIDLCSESDESGSERAEGPSIEVPESPSSASGSLSTHTRGRAVGGAQSPFKRTLHIDLTAPEPEAPEPDTAGDWILSAPQSPSLEAVDGREQRRGSGPTASQESTPRTGFTARTADNKRSTNGIETQQNEPVSTLTTTTARTRTTCYTLLQPPNQVSSHDKDEPSLLMHAITKAQGPDSAAAAAATSTKTRPSGDFEMIGKDAGTPKQMKLVSSQKYTTSTSRSSSAKGISKPRTRNTGAALHRPGFRADQRSRNTRRYRFGDCFCGAGGMSSAAEQAGLEVVYGFDWDSVATQSYRLNHPRARCYTAAVHHFLALQDEDLHVDILHLSPPCQPFSPAHTIAGKNDEDNEAALFSITGLIRRTRPRLATFEETSGLFTRHSNYFYQVLDMLTSEGFSVRYKVVNFAEYGLSQARKRVFIVASCPGEPLPRFPLPTHSDDPIKCAMQSLTPLTTINQAIGFLRPGHADHDIERASRLKVEGPGYDGDVPLPRCITTSGGQNYHPSGTRQLTHREYACLQGFPPSYTFVAPHVMRQIGNAVPPIVGKVFLDEFRRALMRSDGLL